MNFFILFLLILLAGGIGFWLYSFLQKKEKEYVSKSLDMCLFLVTMPKHRLDKKKVERQDEKVIIGRMEQILTNFLHLEEPNFFEKIMFGSPRIALEIATQVGGKDICFYVAVPTKIKKAFEKYVQGVYERAVVEEIPKDYTIFEPGGKTAGCYQKTTEAPILPIGTYKKLDKDPLSSITNSLSKIDANEGAAIQVIIRRSGRAWRKIGKETLRRMKKGMSFQKASLEKNFFVEVIEEIVKIFIAPKRENYEQKEPKQIDEKLVQEVERKIEKPIFDANIRILTSAKTQERADQILEHIDSSFGQFSLFSSNGLEKAKLKDKKLEKLIYDFSFRNFDNSQKINLNVEELASVYHFPTFYLETPYIKSAKTGSAEPPMNLPEEGINLIGIVKYRGEEKKVRFASRKDRRRHFYLVGQTGTGKSNLMEGMVRRDLENGEGVGVIDPHGDFAETVLSFIPKDRINDVIYFNPADTERPIGLNMLEYETEAQKDFAVQEMIAIFHKLFPPDITGPIFEHYMRNGLLGVMADPEKTGTIVDLPRIFTEEAFLEEKLEKMKNPMLRRFWTEEWKQMSRGTDKSEMLTYIISKVGRFIENNLMSNIIGQPESGFDLADIMNSRKIFVANLSKGLIGEMNAALLGLILVTKIQMIAMKRANMPKKERQDFYLYIDEFQNFTTDSVATILSEARKYHLNLILAHQYMPQLKEEIKDAVLGNTGTIGAFRVGADDAEFLEKQFEPNFSRFDLVNLPNYQLILKLMINGEITNAFKVSPLHSKGGDPEKIKRIKEISRLKYGTPKEIVESRRG